MTALWAWPKLVCEEYLISYYYSQGHALLCLYHDYYKIQDVWAHNHNLKTVLGNDCQKGIKLNPNRNVSSNIIRF